MITADTIRRCSNLDSITLERLLRKSYPKDLVIRSEFLGISNGDEFVYKIVYPDQYGDMGISTTKVFVWEKGNSELSADY